MADQPPKKLDCPKCLGRLEVKEIGEMQRMPVYIDQCPVCMGIWFDEGELEKILQLKIEFDDERVEEEFRLDLKDSHLDLKEAKCPRCREKMERVKAPKDDRVITDYCLKCGGTWLDGGEIRVLMRGGALHRGVQLIMKKLTAPFRNMQARRHQRY